MNIYFFDTSQHEIFHVSSKNKAFLRAFKISNSLCHICQNVPKLAFWSYLPRYNFTKCRLKEPNSSFHFINCKSLFSFEASTLACHFLAESSELLFANITQILLLL
jgi:hypothetical protein